MADIELVIKIPEAYFEALKKTDEIVSGQRSGKTFMSVIYEAVAKGTSLPEGHGRLKDIDWIDDNCPDYRTEDGAWCYKWEDINSAPTIIEADKTGRG